MGLWCSTTHSVLTVPTEELRRGVLVEFTFGSHGLSLYVDGELVDKASAPSGTSSLPQISKPLMFGVPHRDFTGELSVAFTIYEFIVWPRYRDDIFKGELFLLFYSSTVRSLTVSFDFSATLPQLDL